MCNLYSVAKGRPQAIRDFVRVVPSEVGDMPPLPGILHFGGLRQLPVQNAALGHDASRPQY